jgi:ferredoxin
MKEPAKPPIAEVSHDLCMGTSMCTQAAPRAFRLNENGQAVFQGPATATPQELEDAAFACPMAAITVRFERG